MKKENKNEHDIKGRPSYCAIPNLIFQDVRIPESLAPTPINPATDDANQLNIPRNPGPALHALDWDIPNEPLVTDKKVHATPNPHTDAGKKKEK